jgi:hypothetical protein
MKIIYFVVACIFSAIAWIATQLTWQYANILFYIAIFLVSWFVALIFIYQENNEESKKYTILTPSNIIYFAIIAVLLIFFRKYDIQYYATAKYSFYKLVTIVNAAQGVFMIIFYKLRDIFYHC